MKDRSVHLSAEQDAALAEVSARTGISKEELVAAAVQAMLARVERFRGSSDRDREAMRAAFEGVLARVPDVPPLRGDEISPVSQRPRRSPRKTP